MVNFEDSRSPVRVGMPCHGGGYTPELSMPPHGCLHPNYNDHKHDGNCPDCKESVPTNN